MVTMTGPWISPHLQKRAVAGRSSAWRFLVAIDGDDGDGRLEEDAGGKGRNSSATIEGRSDVETPGDDSSPSGHSRVCHPHLFLADAA